MDLRKLKTLIDLVADSNITELEITEAEGKVRIVKSGSQVAATTAAPMQVAIPAAPLVAQVPGGSEATAPESPSVPAANKASGHIVKSPMVGTFYCSASPGGKPFVEVGDSIKQGETICIIEAMKILNEIECDFTGTITKILAENGQAVEYGQPLFVIE
ncbi:MAG: acetyl-CoA carboxylase biotin carboxyl carrier protein [Limnohabitans sp.]|nr:acetyl-CoA carboxylase biotin carboxyl carrier protein [Limnohabitans sp.]